MSERRAPPPPALARALLKLVAPRDEARFATLPDDTFMALLRALAPPDGRCAALGRCAGRLATLPPPPGRLAPAPAPAPPPGRLMPAPAPPPGLSTWLPLRPRKSIR